MAIDPGRVKALFQSAIERPDPDERRAFLDREVGDDSAMHARLDALLAEHDRPPGALDRPLDADFLATLDRPGGTGDVSWVAPGGTVADEPALGHKDVGGLALLDTVIAGRYKLRQEIGEGGMGSVYLAEQLRPVKRMVALKLIKPGMDTRTVLARFESERQALALMDHPHIAKVLDAGSTDSGRPFFVMELVKGVPINEYCDRRRLGIPERLAIFRQVCSAVQHAHQKGIIHRDLKPSNILVEAHDEEPVPKVIDFGLAKATSGMKLTDQSLFTAFGSVTGTPLYMAPEQASFNALDVDTRADIYALGVILYELLTGSTPIRRETVQRSALDEMLRVIREDEPPTPSSRISTSEALPSLAANRHIEPTRLSRFVKGDLDWIVMKALAKERHRRYDSAIGLANDLERFANHEPVGAGPPTAGYRMRKFVRRNRGQMVAASLVLLALVVGIVGTTVGLFRARRQEAIAVEAAAQREKARLAEADQRRQAERRLAQIEKANEILGSIFKDLDPFRAEGEGKPLAAVLGERLDQATAQIEGDAIGDPLSVARMQRTLGRSQLALGYGEKAVGLFARSLATTSSALGPGHPEALASMTGLATAYNSSSQRDRAVPLFEEVLERTRSTLGPDHPDTLESMSRLGSGYILAGQPERAIPLLEKALERTGSTLGPDHPTTLANMNSLATAYQAAGQLDRALSLYEKAQNTVGLAIVNGAAGQPERAIPVLEKALEQTRSKLGPDHPNTLGGMNRLATSYMLAGQPDRAVPLFEKVLEPTRSKVGPDHPLTLNYMNNLASAYKAAGRPDRALPMFEQVLERRKSRMGPDHPDTLRDMHNLAWSYRAAGQPDRALSLLEKALELGKARLGPDHPDVLHLMRGLAQLYQAVGQPDRAPPILEKVLERTTSKPGPDDPTTLQDMNDLGMAFRDAGRLDRALPLLEKALELRKAKLGPDHPETLAIMNNLARASIDAGRRDRALTMLSDELATLRKRKGGADSLPYAGVLAQLSLVLLQEKKWAEAESSLREALAIREAKEPDAWSTFNSRAQLGGALLGQKKYAEAEPLLRAGYEGMKRRADKIPQAAKVRVVEALDRLIELAEATGKPDDARKWKDEKAKRLAPSPPDGKKP